MPAVTQAQVPQPAAGQPSSRRPNWDRVNFGRVLRQLRKSAGLTQDELGERMGRDRRRVLVLEQGSAVREPGATELALLAAALGDETAAGQLERAARPDGPAQSRPACSPRERAQGHLASDFSRLLSRVDDVRDGARSLARAVDQLFDESLVPSGVVQRSRRAVAALAAAALAELHRQTRYVRRTLDTPACHDTWAGTVRDFRQRQSHYWSCCVAEGWPGQDLGEPDALERTLDILEMATFHLHREVSGPATSARRALGHLFLFWAELAMRAAADLEATTRFDRGTRRSGGHQPGVAFQRFSTALRSFEELPLVAFAEQLYYRDAPQTARYDIRQVGALWERLSEELPGLTAFTGGPVRLGVA